MNFNKKIVTSFFEDETERRNLQSDNLSRKYKAEDLFKISVEGAEDEDYLDKGVATYNLTKVDDTSIAISVSFS